MLVPMFNAELAPPGIRGSLVALQQLAITFGILISYWIGYSLPHVLRLALRESGTGRTISGAQRILVRARLLGRSCLDQ